MAAHYKMPFFEVSAKTNTNINAAFERLTEDLLDLIEDYGPSLKGVGIGNHIKKLKKWDDPDVKKKGCC